MQAAATGNLVVSLFSGNLSNFMIQGFNWCQQATHLCLFLCQACAGKQVCKNQLNLHRICTGACRHTIVG